MEINHLEEVQALITEMGYKDREQVSDGYHTFKELYDHRTVLTALALKSMGMKPWKSLRHHDGSEFTGYFIVGALLPNIGQVSYHYPLRDWELFEKFPEVDYAPEWDGHSANDVVRRLQKWIKEKV